MLPHYLANFEHLTVILLPAGDELQKRQQINLPPHLKYVAALPCKL